MVNKPKEIDFAFELYENYIHRVVFQWRLDKEVDINNK